MSIILNNKDGVLLKTAGKYCPDDIIVKPNLQTKTVTANGDISPDVGYCGLEKVTVSVPATPTQEKTITITENGTQEVTPDSGNVLSKVTVTTNVPSVQPTLNAPTISLSGSTITITNPSSNGNFVTSYKVFNGATLLATVTSTTVDLLTYISTAGTYTITVKASAANFNDSAASNSESYEAKTQTTPAISLASGTIIQIDTIDDNATTIEVYADGTKIGEVAKQ